MEPPSSLSGPGVAKAKVELLKAVSDLTLEQGQWRAPGTDTRPLRQRAMPARHCLLGMGTEHALRPAPDLT